MGFKIMRAHIKPSLQTKMNLAPLSEFEISISSTLVGDKKKVSKGHFMFWGNVRACNVPA